MKKVLCISLLFVFLFNVTGCRYVPFIKDHNPMYRNYTKWSSEDGNIRFSIGFETSFTCNSIGIMKINDKEIPISLGSPYINSYLVYVIMLETDEDFCEEWYLIRFSEKHFTVEVLETTFFTVGDKITFYLMEENSVR